MKTLKSKSIAMVISAALGLLLAAGGVMAQEYPNKPIRLLVGYVPGGTPDLIARVVGNKLSQVLGQPVVIDNRPGAGGTLATELVARAPADGYTLLLGETGQLVIAPFITKNLRYDTLRDLTPIAFLGSTPLVLVVNAKTSGLKNIGELLREAKTKPGTHYGSSGVGTIHHIATEALLSDAGVSMSHVPYKGSGQSVPAILSGEIPLLMTSLTAVFSHVKAGTVRVLAVTTGARYKETPDVPSVSEFVKGYDFASESGILGPANLPPEIVEKLSKALKEVMASPEVLEKLAGGSVIPTWTTPEGYRENIVVNLKKYERAVKASKVEPQ